MAAGTVVNNYEPSMVIEGTSKAGFQDLSPVDAQVRVCIKLLNVISFEGYREAFFRSVMVLDTALLLSGKDREYLDQKEKLMKKYKINDEKIEEITDKHIEYAHNLLKEQLSMINRKKEKDITGELDVSEEELAEQEELTIDDKNDRETIHEDTEPSA